jgi:hypothetical protein
MTGFQACKRAMVEEWRVSRWAIYALLLFLFGTETQALQRLEGLLFPVVAGTDITRVIESRAVDGAVSFYGTAHQLRDCRLRRVDWFVETASGLEQVDIQKQDRPNRPGDGLYRFGPWSAYLTRSELLTASHAILHHRCHPFFLTATVFYP